jgi:alpha-N-arabinofuranosidase
MPQISATASKDSEGRIHISLCNLDHQSAADVQIDIKALLSSGNWTIKGTELTAGEINAHNTFDQPDKVAPANYDRFSAEGGVISAKLSPMSVTVLEVSAG